MNTRAKCMLMPVVGKTSLFYLIGHCHARAVPENIELCPVDTPEGGKGLKGVLRGRDVILVNSQENITVLEAKTVIYTPVFDLAQ